MSKITITYEDGYGTNQTYSKEFEGDLFVQDYFETALWAYRAFGFVNGIEVDVYGISGEVTCTMTWDDDNVFQIEDKMSPVDDIMKYVGEKHKEEGWYMGHKYQA